MLHPYDSQKEIEMLMDMPLLMGYENIRCRGPDFPSSLACNESVIEPGRMEQNPQTVLKKVQVCVCVYVYVRECEWVYMCVYIYTCVSEPKVRRGPYLC